ncbi:hypothetical protein CP532_3736 [Ophiocordyceps camponoti-leonardi (nom. inval.)]|nr:hypothetical protein CP532_3736 [Ophiocordyceps camponoti-leonardi (nom. inval.)]
MNDWWPVGATLIPSFSDMLSSALDSELQISLLKYCCKIPHSLLNGRSGDVKSHCGAGGQDLKAQVVKKPLFLRRWTLTRQRRRSAVDHEVFDMAMETSGGETETSVDRTLSEIT